MLDAVERVRETLTAGAAESEERGTLDQVSVDALYQAGFSPLPRHRNWAAKKSTHCWNWK